MKSNPPAASSSARRPDPNSLRLSAVANLAGHVAILLTGAIFGFFYAWVCSTLWGLDEADPRVAIAAMQAMNASVRNAVFFPAFFLTPFALAFAALAEHRLGGGRSAVWFLSAALVYLVGGLLLTMMINVPMNEALAELVVPSDAVEAAALWDAYSGRWQFWNAVRTVASGIALLLASIGLKRSGARFEQGAISVAGAR